MKHVRDALRMLLDAEVTLKLNNCQLFTDKIDYLGHIMRPGRLEAGIHTPDAIRGLKEPTIVTELRWLLGLCKSVTQVRAQCCTYIGSLRS